MAMSYEIEQLSTLHESIAKAQNIIHIGKNVETHA